MITQKPALRIAVVGSRGVPAAYSGVERAVEELGARLTAAGHEVTVFCMAGRYAERPRTYRGMRLRYVPTLSGKHAEMLTHAAISSLAAALGQFDLVHFHACGPSLFCALPRLFGKSTIATLHGVDWRQQKWGRFAAAVLRLGEWSACRAANTVISVSAAGRDELRNRHGVPALCVSNAIACPGRRDPSAIVERWGLARGGYALFVGRLTAVKNLDLLIEAFREIATDKKLVIVGGEAGDPGHVSRLHAMAGSDRRIVFTGPVYDDTLAELYSNAALFCLPSASEGLSLALLEAMAYGLPSLVSAIPGNLELIEHGGRLHGISFPSGNLGALRAALAEALASPEALAELGESARNVVETHYSWDRAAEEMEGIYCELAGKPALPQLAAPGAPAR
jgi:glycosyltransferase involved in cell wall biosynthesis